MDNPIIQIQKWYDETFSIVASVYNLKGKSKIYEHPTLINLNKEEAKKWCQKQIEQSLTTEYIINNWDLIGWNL